jgi:hypothetical protein
VTTHYGVVYFSGDPYGEHPDRTLRGQAPSLTLIAAGPEQFCWTALGEWTAKHVLRQWETAEVVARTVPANSELGDPYRFITDPRGEHRRAK